jgi:hypothetical protein
VDGRVVSSDVVRARTPTIFYRLNISQKALETLPEDGNVMPKHVGACLLTPWSRVLLEKLTSFRS